MKRPCPYCGVRLKKKEREVHVRETHQLRGSEDEFMCLKGCVRCCTDKGMPLELTIGDMARISKHLGISLSDLFEEYCDIMWNRIPYTTMFIPSIGLTFPCEFLEGEKCVIYSVRPLHCRMFPENVVVSSEFEDISPIRGRGYKCIDRGFRVSEERGKRIKRLSELDEDELEKSAMYFGNISIQAYVTDEEFGEVLEALKEVDELEKNEKKRELCTNIIRAKGDEDVIRVMFLEKIKNLQEENLEEYDLLKSI
ncbi:MAG: YkgJ family cysteine cluster protein [Candidatus Hydrothermarchaeales archaeon]